MVQPPASAGKLTAVGAFAIIQRRANWCPASEQALNPEVFRKAETHVG